MPKELERLSEKEIQQRLYGGYLKAVPKNIKKPQSPEEPKEKPLPKIDSGSGMKIVWSFALGIAVIFLIGFLIVRLENTPQAPKSSQKATPRKPPVPTPKTVSAPVNRLYTIQVMVHGSKEGAEISVGELKKRGFPAYIKQSTMVSGKLQFRIYVGEFTTQEEAKATLAMLKTQPSYQESFIRKK